MAVIGNTFLDLAELYKSQPATLGVVPFINTLSYGMPILEDAIALECNKGSENLTTLLSGLPGGGWGRLYKGVPKTKSNRVQVTDTTGVYESMSGVDVNLEDYARDIRLLREEESMAHVQSMSQEMSKTIWYGNTATDPDQFLGFAPRFNKLSGDLQSSQVINGNGVARAGSTSIWFITWGNTQSSLLYPSTTTAGLKRTDHGKVPVLDADGNQYFEYQESFRWNMGLSIRDFRYIVRICNIDVVALQQGSTDVYNLLQQAYYKHQGRFTPMGRTYIYCNTEVKMALDNQAINKGGGDKFIRLRPGRDIQGRDVDMYRNIPIRETNSILNTEGLVV